MDIAIGAKKERGGNVKELILYGGDVTLIDDEDYERCSQFKWHTYRDGATYYARRSIYEKGIGYGGSIKIHQFIMGKPPKGMEIDHIDMDGLNNQKKNLRFVTHRQNMQNNKRRSSKYPGVSWNKANKRWQVIAWFGGKQISLGSYRDEREAFSAYQARVRSIGDEVIGF